MPFTTRLAVAALLASACGETPETPTDAPPIGDAAAGGDAPAGEFTLTVGKSGEGDGTIATVPALDCDSECRVSAPANTLVTLTATPDSRSLIGTWNLLAGAWNVEQCTTNPTCEIALDRDLRLDVRFDVAPVLLTVRVLGTGTGTIRSSPAWIDCGADCSEAVHPGTQIQLVATASAGSTFLGWAGGGCTGTGICMVTVDEAMTVDGYFGVDTSP